MAYLLHIESSSTVCSVAVSKDDQLLCLKELNDGYTHAENLHVFIDQALKEISLKPGDLNAVSVSSGPGSYTGLRIGFSAAKGLAFALGIPLIMIETLKVLSIVAIEQIGTDGIFIPFMDARRMEVYCAAYDNSLNEIIPVQALVLNEETIQMFNLNKPLYFFGDGMPKSQILLEQLPDAQLVENISTSATGMIAIAFDKYKAKDFSELAYSEPNYLKEFYFHTAKK